MTGTKQPAKPVPGVAEQACKEGQHYKQIAGEQPKKPKKSLAEKMYPTMKAREAYAADDQ